MNEYLILKTTKSKDYELLDSGEGEKLERFGKFIVSRPDPQALWPKNFSAKEWQKANAEFSRESENAGWILKNELPEKWKIDFGDLNFWIKPTAFKHVGIFPEQLSNWQWMSELIQKEKRKISVINLFGYTGGATLACAKADAEVCHVDASKVDPPAFGHGPNKELWKIENNFLELIDLCGQVLSDNPLFVLINGYASGYSAIAYKNNLLAFEKKFSGKIEMGELTIEESKSKRLLPCGIYSRFCK